jgi:hypothetical protein
MDDLDLEPELDRIASILSPNLDAARQAIDAGRAGRHTRRWSRRGVSLLPSSWLPVLAIVAAVGGLLAVGLINRPHEPAALSWLAKLGSVVPNTVGDRSSPPAQSPSPGPPR